MSNWLSGVGEECEVEPRCVEPGAQGFAVVAVDPVADQPDGVVLAGPFPHEHGRGVGRPVVDDDDLELLTQAPGRLLGSAQSIDDVDSSLHEGSTYDTDGPRPKASLRRRLGLVGGRQATCTPRLSRPWLTGWRAARRQKLTTVPCTMKVSAPPTRIIVMRADRRHRHN